jgi:hypothetical protein
VDRQGEVVVDDNLAGGAGHRGLHLGLVSLHSILLLPLVLPQAVLVPSCPVLEQQRLAIACYSVYLGQTLLCCE